jgi:hypothetical protein
MRDRKHWIRVRAENKDWLNSWEATLPQVPGEEMGAELGSELPPELPAPGEEDINVDTEIEEPVAAGLGRDRR